MRERIRQIHWYLLPRQDVNGCTRKSAEFYTFGREISYPRAVVNAESWMKHARELHPLQEKGRSWHIKLQENLLRHLFPPLNPSPDCQ